MNRRSFMQSILAAGVAPWIVTSAGVLMPVRKQIEDVIPQWMIDVVIKEQQFKRNTVDHFVQLPQPVVGREYFIRNDGDSILTVYAPDRCVIGAGQTRVFCGPK